MAKQDTPPSTILGKTFFASGEEVNTDAYTGNYQIIKSPLDYKKFGLVAKIYVNGTNKETPFSDTLGKFIYAAEDLLESRVENLGAENTPISGAIYKKIQEAKQELNLT